MIAVVKDNIIVNLISGDRPTGQDQRIAYPWSRLWSEYTDEMPLDYAKQVKVAEMKSQRDAAEVMPIEVGGYIYDYDDKARERIHAAIVALDGTGTTLSWTTAEQQESIVDAEALKNIVRAAAVRSNALHVMYRDLKAQVESVTTKEEVELIVWK